MRYAFAVDRGGTFTDCILTDTTTGRRLVTKVLSSDDAPIRAMRKLLGLDSRAPLPDCSLRLGTTVATNALLERRGAKTALVITRGFGDLLEIGDQTRPYLFDLNIQRPAPLAALSLEVSARLDPLGEVITWPVDSELALIAEELHRHEIESVALVILHAYAATDKEQDLKRRLLGFWPDESPPHVVCSSEVAVEQGLLARASTTVVDAYTAPLIRDYLTGLEQELGDSPLLLMRSSGGLSSPTRFRGPSAILSGPAGGLIAAEQLAQLAGSKKTVTFDMGGTSTDVALLEGEAPLRFEKVVAGVPLVAPMLDIHTVAAGGGSVCAFDGYALSVGPQSVGADPGPLCYGRVRGRDPRHHVALTDVNLVLGRLTDDFFEFPLDRQAATTGLQQLCAALMEKTGEPRSVVELARDFSAIATSNMAEAIRAVTVARGVQLNDADLLIFGGAAGQHACAVADALGLRRIIAHRYSGVLSAYGISKAIVEWTGEQDAGRVTLEGNRLGHFEAEFSALEAKGVRALQNDHRWTQIPDMHRIRSFALRYSGTDSTLDVPFGSIDEIVAAFETAHESRFGFVRSGAALEVVTLRSRLLVSEKEDPSIAPAQPCGDGVSSSSAPPSPLPLRTQIVHLARRTQQNVPVFELHQLTEGQKVEAPALIIDETATYLIEDGFRAELQGEFLLIQRKQGKRSRRRQDDLGDAATIQIAATRFSSIAEQMGEALRRSASSTNIRDRLDFSCAVFDPEGNLVANAPHIPVHLGAMSESVRAVRERFPQMRPRSSFVTNDPQLGGSHLPDITVVTPVFDDADLLIAFTASRGHHADVGGIAPGSMPAFSTSLAQEGVIFRAIPLVTEGIFQREAVLEVLTRNEFPARDPEQNLADLQAQLAANRMGGRLLNALEKELGDSRLSSLMQQVRALSARWMGDAIEALPTETLRMRDTLDDGSPIVVSLRADGRILEVDFDGTAPAAPGNLNAPRAVTVAAVLYALRTLLNRPLPLNQGCLDPLRLKIPAASLLDPPEGSAVAGGNVETSQRVVDVLLGALGLAAASQGTMNNLSFGNEHFGYYETIAGGAGAGPKFSGASCVHTHMTNTRISDAEVLEGRFPVRLWQFSRRPQSGGRGQKKGGDGIVREFEALTALTCSILSERRTTRPFGLWGGCPGQSGANFVNGTSVPGHFEGVLKPGDRLRIETPGGGGYRPEIITEL